MGLMNGSMTGGLQYVQNGNVYRLAPDKQSYGVVLGTKSTAIETTGSGYVWGLTTDGANSGITGTITSAPVSSIQLGCWCIKYL